MAREIHLYTAKICGDCQLLKAFMDDHSVEYVLCDIHEDPEHAVFLEEQTGKLGVPYLRIDGEWVRGYDMEKPFSDEFAKGILGL